MKKDPELIFSQQIKPGGDWKHVKREVASGDENAAIWGI